MGWKYSTHLFMTATEAVADLANTKLLAKVSSQAHRLDTVSESQIKLEIPSPVNVSRPAPLPIPVPATQLRTRPHPIKTWGVYVDDFTGMVQGSANHRRHVKQNFLHSLEEVLRRLDPSNNPYRQESTLIKTPLASRLAAL
jgi:hypothetical protein